jgi:hypothetical protein
LTDSVTSGHDTGPGAAAVPAIAAAGNTVITGSGFLPDRGVIVRVVYSVDGVTDYLAFTSDLHGDLIAEVPISPDSGVVTVSASDHRPDPDGECGMLWSNTATIGGPARAKRPGERPRSPRRGI